MTVHAIFGEGASSNSYVLIGEGAVLVDPGLPQRAKRVLSESERIGERITAVVLTHRHYDHAGAAPEVARKLGVEIFAPPLEAEALRSGDPLTTGAIMFGGWMPAMDVRDISDAPLPKGWAVLHTPGHTEGSSCLYNRSSGQLVSGDTLFCDGGVGRWDLPTGSLQDLKRSLGMLSALRAGGLYPGHGRWVESGGPLHAELAEDSVRDCR